MPQDRSAREGMTENALGTFWNYLGVFYEKVMRAGAEAHIQRPRSSAHNEQKQQAQQHRKIGSRLTGHAPKAVARQFGNMEAPIVMSEQDGDLGGNDRHGDVDQ